MQNMKGAYASMEIRLFARKACGKYFQLQGSHMEVHEIHDGGIYTCIHMRENEELAFFLRTRVYLDCICK